MKATEQPTPLLAASTVDLRQPRQPASTKGEWHTSRFESGDIHGRRPAIQTPENHRLSGLGGEGGATTPQPHRTHLGVVMSATPKTQAEWLTELKRLGPVADTTVIGILANALIDVSEHEFLSQAQAVAVDTALTAVAARHELRLSRLSSAGGELPPGTFATERVTS